MMLAYGRAGQAGVFEKEPNEVANCTINQYQLHMAGIDLQEVKGSHGHGTRALEEVIDTV